MTPNIDPILIQWCCVFESLRRLGFSADDIHFVVHPGGKALVDGREHNFGMPVISCLLKAQGLEWTCVVGPIDKPADELPALYEQACAAWNDSANHDAWIPLWKQSWVYKSKVELVSSLVAKGFKLSFGLDS